MPTNTSRLGLANPIGADSPSQIRLGATANNATLDNASIYREGTLGSRPVPGPTNHGYVWRTTDAGKETLSWSDGSLWLPLGLIPSSTAVSTGAVSGQAVITTGSSAVTITAPSNTAGAMFAVVNQTTSVTTVSGANIQGLGLSSAASFPLGALGTSAVLLGDGTNWQVIAGHQDTGWVSIGAMPTGWTTLYGQISYRTLGDRVWLSGDAKYSTGGSNQLLLNGFPPPPFNQFFSLAATFPNSSFGYGEIFTTGSFTGPSQNSNGVIGLDGCSYRLV